jgi:hypothetical protein
MNYLSFLIVAFISSPVSADSIDVSTGRKLPTPTDVRVEKVAPPKQKKHFHAKKFFKHVTHPFSAH